MGKIRIGVVVVLLQVIAVCLGDKDPTLSLRPPSASSPVFSSSIDSIPVLSSASSQQSVYSKRPNSLHSTVAASASSSSSSDQSTSGGRNNSPWYTPGNTFTFDFPGGSGSDLAAAGASSVSKRAFTLVANTMYQVSCEMKKIIFDFLAFHFIQFQWRAILRATASSTSCAFINLWLLWSTTDWFASASLHLLLPTLSLIIRNQPWMVRWWWQWCWWWGQWARRTIWWYRYSRNSWTGWRWRWTCWNRWDQDSEGHCKGSFVC